MQNWLQHLSVKEKIMAPLAGLIFVVFLVLGVALNNLITNNALETFAADTERQVVQVDNAMHIFLTGLRDGLVNMANDPLLKQGGEITRYFEQTPGADGMVAMEPAAKGGFEAQAYQLFQRYAHLFPLSAMARSMAAICSILLSNVRRTMTRVNVTGSRTV